MKRFSLYLNFALLLLSCQGPRPKARRVDWSAYQQAYAWLSKQRDSAFYHFNEVAVSSPDSLPAAMAYNVMAAIQADAGDYYGAQESLTQSLRYLDSTRKADRACLANDYNELGMTSADLKHYPAAAAYYQEALKYAADGATRSSILNNLAFAHQQNGNLATAQRLYERLLREDTTTGTSYARRLTNLAVTKWMAEPGYPAARELCRALAIRSRNSDLWGENSSYGHLADYYQRMNPDSARFFARRFLETARRLQSPDDELDALKKLIALSPPDQSVAFFRQYMRLDDSLQTARAAAKNQFALIRYNVEKGKAANLRLQQDNARKQYELGGLLAFLLIASVGTVFWYRKRRQRMKLEKEKAVQETQLRLSQKVHDVVANRVYRMMNELEYAGTIDRSYLLDELEVTYELSRDISYDPGDLLTDEFAGKMERLLGAFSNGDIKLALEGNDPLLWQRVPHQIKLDVELILQELMVNMRKHSQASRALIAFSVNQNILILNYRDNGVGLPDQERNRGNGLENTENRIGG